jgi:hypothetical protein
MTTETTINPKSRFRATEHPLLPLPGAEEIEEALQDPERAERMLYFLTEREKRIGKAEEDRLRYGFEFTDEVFDAEGKKFTHWKDADDLLYENDFVYASGGNRSSKTEWFGRRFLEAALTYAKGKSWAFQDSLLTSIGTQQQLIWDLLPRELKALNSPGRKR